MEVAPHQILTSAFNGGKWLTSWPGHFTPEKKYLVLFELEVGCVEVSLYFLEYGKSLPPIQIRIPGCPERSPLTTSTALTRLVELYDPCKFQRFSLVFRKSEGEGVYTCPWRMFARMTNHTLTRRLRLPIIQCQHSVVIRLVQSCVYRWPAIVNGDVWCSSACNSFKQKRSFDRRHRVVFIMRSVWMWVTTTLHTHTSVYRKVCCKQSGVFKVFFLSDSTLRKVFHVWKYMFICVYIWALV